jgi:hypothetical protein
MQFIHAVLNSALGCYVLGSLLLAFGVMTSMLAERRLHGRMAWMTVATCLPFMNVIIVSFLVLECVSLFTGNPIIIGRRKA